MSVGDMRFAQDALCGRCLGSGQDNGGVCPDCQGSGQILGAERCGACGASLRRQVGRFQFVCAKGHTTVSQTARRTTG